MPRLIVLAAAIMLAAAPVSAKTIRITAEGKSAQALAAEIRAAARTVCYSMNRGPAPLGAQEACVSLQVRSAIDQLKAGPAAELTSEFRPRR